MVSFKTRRNLSGRAFQILHYSSSVRPLSVMKVKIKSKSSNKLLKWLHSHATCSGPIHQKGSKQMHNQFRCPRCESADFDRNSPGACE